MPEGVQGTVYGNWQASGLPPGLSIDATTGEISGVPEESGEFAEVVISALDPASGQTLEAECGALTINASLNAFSVRDQPRHCIDVDTPVDEWQALLTGGDGSAIVCRPLDPDTSSATCPLGDGQGRPPPGISFDAESCEHSGTIDGDRFGTFVWMIEVEQSGFVTTVPFCATNDIDTFHTIELEADGETGDPLQPGLLSYDPSQDLAFGDGSRIWTISDPACPGDDCNNFGFRFNVTCSPFDADGGFQITLSPSSGLPEGLTHQMTATGPAPDERYASRPFVASFEMSYCTSADGTFCDVDDTDQFEQNAQTRYHYGVIGYPD